MSRGRRDPAELFEAAGNGDRAATARLLSLIERGGEPAREVGRLAAPLAGSAYTIGMTGAPGSGKSTLTSATIKHLRRQGEEVAVLAIDPSSPFTGGAILGDRVRMQDHATDHGVFIRSMATRGHLGGLSLATPEAIRLLDALGHRWILVETVGVGQVEVEVAGKADTTVVVVNPGWGDSVQANKAGLMEVADVFVINKADRPGVPETKRDLQQMLELSAEMAHESADADAVADHPALGWKVPIVATVGQSGDGVPELWAAVLAHREYASSSGLLERRRRFRLGEELREIVARRLEQRARELCTGEEWDALTARVLARDVDPWSAADSMLAPVLH
jgi:LAO/AO transport system kinase